MSFVAYMQFEPALFLTFVGLFSIVVGSFLNVVIYRLPLILDQEWREECAQILELKPEKRIKPFNLLLPRSHCPNCRRPLALHHNIPLLSYLFLKGKCAMCGAKIPLRYPIVELISCVASIIVAATFGVTWTTLAALIVTWSLITIIFIDIEWLIIPDIVTIPLIWLALFCSIFGLFCFSTSAILGGICGYLILWIIAKLFKLFRGVEGMGHGDFKLLAMFGALLGWQNLPFIILLASLAGAIIGIAQVLCKKHKFNKPLPFGPYLATAGWIAMLWGPTIFSWYLHTIGIH